MTTYNLCFGIFKIKIHIKGQKNYIKSSRFQFNIKKQRYFKSLSLKNELAIIPMNTSKKMNNGALTMHKRTGLTITRDERLDYSVEERDSLLVS